jgi:exodeoxyribonuclease III
LRIDHLLLSPAQAPRLKSARVDRAVRAWENASDHAPVWIEIADGATERAKGKARRSSRTVGQDASSRLEAAAAGLPRSCLD